MTSMGNAGGSAAAQARRQREKAVQLNRIADNYDKGAAGEARVAEALRQLDSRFSVLHDLDVPRGAENIDHLVVGPTGVWVIDAKAYEGTLKESGGTLWNGRYSIRSKCSQTKSEADRLSAHLDVPVRTVLCFVDTGLPSPVQEMDGVTACSLEALVDLVRSGPSLLQPEVIEVLATQAAPLVRCVPYAASAPQQKPTQRAATSRSGAKPRTKAASKAAPSPGRALLLLGGMVAACVGFIALAPTISRVVGNRYAAGLEESLPASLTPATAATAMTTTVVPDTTTAPLVDAPPTVQFACSASGHGWDATFAPTAFAEDPDGYHVWYRVGGEGHNWSYAGVFRSGLSDVTGVGSIDPLTSFELRYDREWLYPTQGAGYAAFTTGAAC